MISNQVLQETMNGIKNITEVDLCVTDVYGHPIVKTMEQLGDVETASRNMP